MWLKSEYEDKIADMENKLKAREEELLAQIEKSKTSELGGEQDENNLSAFLQCGVVPSDVDNDEATGDDSYTMKKAEIDSIKSEYELKLTEMEQTIFDKEDHFVREIEVLKSRNKKMANELDTLKMRGELDELNGSQDTSGDAEDKANTIKTLGVKSGSGMDLMGIDSDDESARKSKKIKKKLSKENKDKPDKSIKKKSKK